MHRVKSSRLGFICVVITKKGWRFGHEYCGVIIPFHARLSFLYLCCLILGLEGEGCGAEGLHRSCHVGSRLHIELKVQAYG